MQKKQRYLEIGKGKQKRQGRYNEKQKGLADMEGEEVGEVLGLLEGTAYGVGGAVAALKHSCVRPQ